VKVRGLVGASSTALQSLLHLRVFLGMRRSWGRLCSLTVSALSHRLCLH
jgi:hypothetical protein